MGTRARLAFAATMGTAALSVLLAAPAAAANGPDILLELSHDGVNYSPGTIQDIFDKTGGYVPGESRTGTVWVRNASADDAQLSLGILNSNAASGSPLPVYLSLQVASGLGSAGVQSFPDAGGCNPVVQGWTMTGGGALKLTLDMGLALQAPNATRNQESDFGLVFVLQGIGGGQPVSPCAGTSMTLPGTGAPAGAADGVAVGTAVLSHGTAQTAGASKQLSPRDVSAAGAGADFQSGGYAGAEAQVESPKSPWSSWLWSATEPSNVIANIRSPWPWIACLGAGAYMAMSFRRRKRNS